ncbi:hypothetical protein ACUOCP_34550, partial [Escherichia sp. R-CC3]
MATITFAPLPPTICWICPEIPSVWVFSDNPERYAELFGGAQQWGQQ